MTSEVRFSAWERLTPAVVEDIGEFGDINMTGTSEKVLNVSRARGCARLGRIDVSKSLL
jgi:hypothetical protein